MHSRPGWDIPNAPPGGVGLEVVGSVEGGAGLA